MFRKLRLGYLNYLKSCYSTRVEVDSSLKQNFESKEYKPRKHPGTIRVKNTCIPLDIQKAITIVLEDNDAKRLYQDSLKLRNYLYSRLLPPEEEDINVKAAKIYNKLLKSKKYRSEDTMTEKQVEEQNRKLQTTVFNLLKKNLYMWANISYDKPTSLQYLMSRAAPEYAVLVRILDEIVKKYPDYKPRSFFDFGSGVGTGTWAINTYWKDSIFEYFCVDTSSCMHDLARLILCKGNDNVQFPLRGYFQRQFLPASTDMRYNIVLAAYSLFELPNMKNRLETIQKLWNKTEDYLIIVEQGTNAGFEIVSEAREFVLNLTKDTDKGYAFSPCPNDKTCPRYVEHKTPCNFIMKYEPLPFPNKSELCTELFSYVILKKGERPRDDPQWPRIVRAPIVRSGHTICRLCTAEGNLEEIIFSKSKHDTVTYRCARSSNWGDVLPVK